MADVKINVDNETPRNEVAIINSNGPKNEQLWKENVFYTRITSPYNYIKARKDVLDKDKSIIIVKSESKDTPCITFIDDISREGNTTIIGQLKRDILFTELFLNKEDYYSVNQLENTLIKYRSYFHDLQAYNTLVEDCRKMKLHIQTISENSNDKQGNTTQRFERVLTEKPFRIQSFMLQIPIFEYESPHDLSIDLLFNIDTTGKSLKITLFSPTLYDLRPLESSIIDRELTLIKEIFPTAILHS